MIPKDTPFPFDNIPDENYFGEFRELSYPLKPDAKKDNDPVDMENLGFYESFDEFSIFPGSMK